MLILNNPYTEAYFNIAAEEYFLKNSKEDFFLLYQNEPSVIIGKHQNLEAEVNLSLVNKSKIKVVRRFSGGGSVYHDLGNINLTFIENNPGIDLDKYVRIITDMLTKLGIQAETDQRRAMFIDGLKISGSAQGIYKNRVLYHATLLFSTDLQYLVSVLEGNPAVLQNIPDEKIYIKSVKSPVTNIREYLKSSLDIKQVKDSILDYMLNLNPDNSLYQFSKKDIWGIGELKRSKYETPEWNLNKTLRHKDSKVYF